MKVSFDTDPDKAMQDTSYWAGLALSPKEKMGVEDSMELEKLANALQQKMLVYRDGSNLRYAMSMSIVFSAVEKRMWHLESAVRSRLSQQSI